MGLSLVEVVATIVMTGIILAFMAPPILISVGTRFQNRRGQQAQLLAQQEIDRVQAAMARGDDTLSPPELGAGNPAESAAAPTQFVNNRASATNPTYAFEQDIDGDGRTDFFVQRFRDEGVDFTAGIEQGQLAVFQMGVRVYTLEAKKTVDAGVTLETDQAPLGLTAGIGKQATQPLAVLFSEISRSDRELSLEEYKRYCNKYCK
ncbi:hypothetical protein [Rubidibacter lacunae]|nr:hypothetical protein [Rubidibacter lacunae]